MKLFRPKLILEKYQDLNFKDLYEKGYNTILIDIDNTLAPYFEERPDENATAFVNLLKKAGFRVVVFSNNSFNRVSTFAECLDCDWNGYSLKPLPFSYMRIMKRFNLKKNSIICMGDQLLTDIVGANFMNLYSVYVKPLCDKDSFATKINRTIEREIFKHL